MRVNPKYIQLVGDALIPVLGYFWWGWNLYFIVLFYLLDYLSAELFLHVKSKKIVSFQKIKHFDPSTSSGKPKLNATQWYKNGIFSAVLLLFSFFLIHLAMRSIHPDIFFIKELNKFWNLKDIGIEQGYVLLPLIALIGFQRYKLEFIVTNKFKSIDLNQLWKVHLTSHYLILACSAFIIGLSTFIVFPEILYIFGIIVFSSGFQLLGVMFRSEKKRSKESAR